MTLKNQTMNEERKFANSANFRDRLTILTNWFVNNFKEKGVGKSFNYQSL